MIMNDTSNVEIFSDFKCPYGWFWSAGLIEILSPTITATETKMSVMLFKASALTAAES